MHLAELRQRRADGSSYADLGYFSVAVPFARVCTVFQSRPDVFLPTTTTTTALQQLQLFLVDDLGSIELVTLDDSSMVKVTRPARPFPLTAAELDIQQAARAVGATLAQISADWKLEQDISRRREAQDVADLQRQDVLLDLAFAALEGT